MTEYNEGDLVEAVRGERRVIDRLKLDDDGDLYLPGAGNIENCFEPLSSPILERGYTITVIEKAAPDVVLPSEPGIYVTYIDPPTPKVIHKLNDGRWVNADDTYYMDDNQVAKCLPLTKLEPVAVAAEKVLLAFMESHSYRMATLSLNLSDNSTASALIDDVHKLAVKFGVDL